MKYVIILLGLITCANAQALDPRDYGVTGINDDTAAWVTMLAAIPNYSTILMPNGFKSRVSILDLSGRRGFKFVGSNAGPGSASTQPTLVYIGAPGGVLVKCAPCADVSFEGMEFDANNLADFGFQAAYGAGLTTQNVSFYRVSFERDATTNIGRPNFIALDWCGTGATSNCEMLSVRESNFRGSGIASNSIGIRIGHSNAVQNGLDGNFIENFGYAGISIVGMTRVSRTVFDSNGTDIHCQASEPSEIVLNRTENGRQFFSGNCPVVMRSNRFGSHIAGADGWIDNGKNASNATTLFENNFFSNNDLLPPFSPGSSAALYSTLNWYSAGVADLPNHKLPAMQNFGTGFVTFLDSFYGGWVRPEMKGWGPFTVD